MSQDASVRLDADPDTQHWIEPTQPLAHHEAASEAGVPERPDSDYGECSTNPPLHPTWQDDRFGTGQGALVLGQTHPEQPGQARQRSDPQADLDEGGENECDGQLRDRSSGSVAHSACNRRRASSLHYRPAESAMGCPASHAC